MTARRVVLALLLIVLLQAMLLSERNRDAPPPAPAPLPLTTTERAVVATPVEANYVGNTNSHKFHRSTCRYAGCKNCTAKFKTRQEAIDAGYRPGGCCDP